jgi:hypothetical protein
LAYVWDAVVPDETEELSPQSIVVEVIVLCESVQLLDALTESGSAELCGVTVGGWHVGAVTVFDATTMLKLAVAVFEFASVTFTVKLAVPAVVGVPEITPAVLSVSPAGKLPDEIDQLYGEDPPVTCSVWLYAVETVPPGRLVVVTVNCETTTILSVCVAALELVSVTFTVKFAVPAVVGVPEITPAVFNVNPAGRLPDEIVHVYGEVPPVTCSVWLYAVETVPPGRLVVVTVIETTTILSACVTALELASVTFTVKFAVPAVVSVPEITPAVLNASPGGKLPEEIDQL